MKKRFSLAAITSLVLLCGCVVGSPPQSINNNPLVEIAVIDDVGLFAADRDGQKVAVAKNGLLLLDLDSSSKHKLSPDQPIALSWNPDGSVLAAAFSIADYETRLKLYSAQGELLHETVLPAALSQMVWSVRGDLLVTGFALKAFSFGASLQQFLYRVNGADVVTTVLSDTTLRLTTMQRFLPVMPGILPMAFSPSGDELVYVQLHEPPQFQPYMQLLYQNWQVGEGRSLQKMPLQTLQLTWGKSEQSVMVNSANGVHKLDLWPTAEGSLNQSVAGRYSFTNGHLYDGEELVADWGESAQLQILSAGRFLLSVKNVLYLGDGLQVEENESHREKSWILRRWRFEGLITPDEYLDLLREENP